MVSEELSSELEKKGDACALLLGAAFSKLVMDTQILWEGSFWNKQLQFQKGGSGCRRW